jgi:hypothetical protein
VIRGAIATSSKTQKPSGVILTNKKLPDSIAGHPRSEIEQYYDVKLTDKQWKLLVEYTTDRDPEYETAESLIVDFINKIDLLEWASDEYKREVKKQGSK